MQVYFADGIINISLSGNGLVRLEFGSVAQPAPEATDQQVVLTPTHQVVMPIDGFLRAFGTQEQVMKKLLEDGVIKRREDEENAAKTVN